MLPTDATWGATLEAHLAFHRALVDAAGSPRLSRAYALLWTEASLGLVAARNHPLSAQRGQLETHDALLTAIVAGPADVAGRLAREHLTIGLDTALAAITSGE
jgi:DNA-binding GntR family transcriptional regulator